MGARFDGLGDFRQVEGHSVGVAAGQLAEVECLRDGRFWLCVTNAPTMKGGAKLYER